MPPRASRQGFSGCVTRIVRHGALPSQTRHYRANLRVVQGRHQVSAVHRRTLLRLSAMGVGKYGGQNRRSILVDGDNLRFSFTSRVTHDLCFEGLSDQLNADTNIFPNPGLVSYSSPPYSPRPPGLVGPAKPRHLAPPADLGNDPLDLRADPRYSREASSRLSASSSSDSLRPSGT